MRLHFSSGTIIGGVNCIFLKKSWYLYKCKEEMLAYAISRRAWNQLEKDFAFMCKEAKKKILLYHVKEIRTPLRKYK